MRCSVLAAFGRYGALEGGAVIGAFEWSTFASSAVLLVLGAALTSFLVPFITRRWQNHQKELELKTDLLRRVSEAVTRVVTHGWFTRLAGKTWGDSSDRQEFTWGFGEWLTETRVLEAELQAYFQSDDAIRRQWATYCEMLRAFHELSWIEGDLPEAERHEKRAMWLTNLRTIYERPELWTIEAHRRGRPSRNAVYRASPVEDVDWDAFQDPGSSHVYIVRQWPTLKKAMEAPLDALCAAILGTPMEPLNDWHF